MTGTANNLDGSLGATTGTQQAMASHKFKEESKAKRASYDEDYGDGDFERSSQVNSVHHPFDGRETPQPDLVKNSSNALLNNSRRDDVKTAPAEDAHRVASDRPD